MYSGLPDPVSYSLCNLVLFQTLSLLYLRDCFEEQKPPLLVEHRILNCNLVKSLSFLKLFLLNENTVLNRITGWII